MSLSADQNIDAERIPSAIHKGVLSSDVDNDPREGVVYAEAAPDHQSAPARGVPVRRELTDREPRGEERNELHSRSALYECHRNADVAADERSWIGVAVADLAVKRERKHR